METAVTPFLRLIVWIALASSWTDSLHAVTAQEAAGRVGEDAAVTGQVVRVVQLNNVSGKPVIFDFDESYPNAVFQAVIFAKDRSKFPDDLMSRYQGQILTVSGRIGQYRGVPQIVLTSPEQIGSSGESGGGAGPSPESPLTTPTAVGVLDAPRAQADEVMPESTREFSSDESTSARMEVDLPPNLLVNSNFSEGRTDWDLPRGSEIFSEGRQSGLRIKLDPRAPQIVSQRISRGIPRDAIQFQAFFQARLTAGSSLSGSLRLELGKPGLGSHFDRPVRASPGTWQEIKWTRTSDLPRLSAMTFSITIPPGVGAFEIRDPYLFAHPDWKDKATWKVSDG